MKKKLVLLLAVVLTLTLALPSVAVADPPPAIPDGYLEPMNYFCVSDCWCGPSSGGSIANYYRDRDPIQYGNNYAGFPADDNDMYDRLHEYMDTGITGYTDKDAYGPGFVEMALHYGYDNFSYVHYGPESSEGQVDEDFYDDVLIPAIDNGWPIALASMRALYGFSGVEAIYTDEPPEPPNWPATVWHWIAIKGYDGWYSGYDNVVICTDSYSHADNLYLDWDQIVAEVGTDYLEAVVIKDDETPDAFVEDFEWGDDGDSLEDWQSKGGEVDWEVTVNGDSIAEIDDYAPHTGTKCARFYKDGTVVRGYYSLKQPSYIGFEIKKDSAAYASIINGDGSKIIDVKYNSAEELRYYTGSAYIYVTTLSAFYWHHIEFKNIDWEAGTYDIWVADSYRTTATMRSGSGYNGNLYFESLSGAGMFWIDDIVDLISEPTTLELWPETDWNWVGTYPQLIATVYDQNGDGMEGVEVTWSMSGVGSFYYVQDVTNADGRAMAWITTSVPGISIVRCQVTGGSPSEYDTATNYWTASGGAVTEGFEWGNDGDSLEPAYGLIPWDVGLPPTGDSVVEIDTSQKHSGTRSGHWQRVGIYDLVNAIFDCSPLDNISFYLRTDGGTTFELWQGDGSHVMSFRVTQDGSIEYEYANNQYADTGCDITLNDWQLIEVRNINWGAGTYNIYADGDVAQISASMRVGSGADEIVVFSLGATSTPGDVWIDDIIYYTPEATALELVPETGENPVDTSHELTATVYDQFGYAMDDVAVTWSIDGVGSFSGTPESPTDGIGEADAEITSAVPGTSTVRCEVTGNPSVYDTATKDWTYIPEATTLELLPETGENPVDTPHELTATVRDQFNNVMEDVAVTWSISDVGTFSSPPESPTDGNGQADAVITSSVLGTSTVRCEVTGNPSVYDTATKDWTYLEDFEWGNDGDSLGMDGGNIDWTVETDGSSVAEIDTAQANSGTRSGRFYYDGSSENIQAYYSQDSPTWRGFYLRKDKNAVAYTITGNETNTVFVRVTKNEFIQYYDGSWHNVCKISANTWHFIEFRNIDWGGGTYDIYVDNDLEKSDTPMSASTSYNGLTAYYGGDYEGEFWIDDILK